MGAKLFEEALVVCIYIFSYFCLYVGCGVAGSVAECIGAFSGICSLHSWSRLDEGEVKLKAIGVVVTT